MIGAADEPAVAEAEAPDPGAVVGGSDELPPWPAPPSPGRKMAMAAATTMTTASRPGMSQRLRAAWAAPARRASSRRAWRRARLSLLDVVIGSAGPLPRRGRGPAA